MNQEETFHQSLTKLRDMRVWMLNNHGDPWGLRQALIMFLEFDTRIAEESSSKEHVESFDKICRENARNLADEFDGTRLRRSTTRR